MTFEVPRIMPEDFNERAGHEVLPNTSKPGEFGGHRMTADSRVFRHYYIDRSEDSCPLMPIMNGEIDIMVGQPLCRVIIW